MKKNIAFLLVLAIACVTGSESFSQDNHFQPRPNTKRPQRPERGDMAKFKGKKNDRKKPAFILAVLRQKYPDQFKELMALRQSDPKQFREEMKKLTQKLCEERNQQKKELAELVKKYRENPSDDTKKQIMEKLSKQFDERLAVMEKAVDKFSEKLDKMKSKLQKRIDNKNAIVEQRFKDLTMDPVLRW